MITGGADRDLVGWDLDHLAVLPDDQRPTEQTCFAPGGLGRPGERRVDRGPILE
jgi:hypothetical protein